MGGSEHQQTTSTQSNTIDPAQMAQYQANYKQAQQNAASLAQPYTGQLTAGFTPAQVQAQGILSGVALNPTYTNNANAASNAAQGLVGVDPLSQANVDKYLNPYTNDVINTTMQQLEQQRGMAQNADNQAATAAGAFDGSRAGVQKALTNQYYDQNAGSLIANLNQAGYTNAQNASLAAQNAIMNNASQAANLNNNAFNTAVNQGQLLSAVGGQQQAQAQNELANLYSAWMTGKQLTVEQQQMLNAALSAIPIQQTINGSSTTDTSTNPGLGGLLGALGSLGAAAATGGVGGAFGGLLGSAPLSIPATTFMNTGIPALNGLTLPATSTAGSGIMGILG